MRHLLTDLAYGTILAVLAFGFSCLLAFAGFGRPYYLGIFLPLCMLAYILIAWLLYLRRDKFMGSPSRMRGAGNGNVVPTLRRDSVDTRVDTGQLPETLVRLAARWDEEPLRRSDSGGAPLGSHPGAPLYGSTGTPIRDGVFSRGGKRALLLAAAELGIAASILYSRWGIGAFYYS